MVFPRLADKSLCDARELGFTGLEYFQKFLRRHFICFRPGGGQYAVACKLPEFWEWDQRTLFTSIS